MSYKFNSWRMLCRGVRTVWP